MVGMMHRRTCDGSGGPLSSLEHQSHESPAFGAEEKGSAASPPTLRKELSCFDAVAVVVGTISTATLPAATVGIAYNQTMAATGGVHPFTWSISAGNLPAGLTVSNAGVISGTPTGTPGTAKFTVTVSDAENPPAKATANLSIVVNSAATALFQGNYAFLFSGYFNGYFTGAGSFVADGAGNITGGIVDTNGLTGPTINGGFTGTYSIGSNSMGTMNWVFTGPGGALPWWCSPTIKMRTPMPSSSAL
jgi:hypothetical protein